MEGLGRYQRRPERSTTFGAGGLATGLSSSRLGNGGGTLGTCFALGSTAANDLRIELTLDAERFRAALRQFVSDVAASTYNQVRQSLGDLFQAGGLFVREAGQALSNVGRSLALAGSSAREFQRGLDGLARELAAYPIVPTAQPAPLHTPPRASYPVAPPTARQLIARRRRR